MENETKSNVKEKKRKAKEYKEHKEKKMNLYEQWFYRHCDSNNTPDIDIIKSQDYDSKNPLQYEDNILRNNYNKPDITNTYTHDYAAWFQRHSTKKETAKFVNIYADILKKRKEEEKRIKQEDYFLAYTPICKKYYPFILMPVHETQTNIYNKDFFCFSCNSHFCIEYKNNHIEHSFIDLDQIKINEEELIKAENSVKIKISPLFNGKFDEKINEKIKKYKDEIIRFNYFIINSYRNEKIIFIITLIFIIFSDLKKT